MSLNTTVIIVFKYGCNSPIFESFTVSDCKSHSQYHRIKYIDFLLSAASKFCDKYDNFCRILVREKSDANK